MKSERKVPEFEDFLFHDGSLHVWNCYIDTGEPVTYRHSMCGKTFQLDEATNSYHGVNGEVAIPVKAGELKKYCEYRNVVVCSKCDEMFRHFSSKHFLLLKKLNSGTNVVESEKQGEDRMEAEGKMECTFELRSEKLLYLIYKRGKGGSQPVIIVVRSGWEDCFHVIYESPEIGDFHNKHLFLTKEQLLKTYPFVKV